MGKNAAYGGICVKYLLDTTQTVPEGVGFPMYGVTHLVWLTVILIFIAGSCAVYRGLRSTQREKMRLLYAGLLLADELYKYIVLIIGDRWLADYLPLHLCSVNLFLIAIHAVRPGKLLDNFLYTVCIPGAAAALLFPSWTSLPFPNLMHLHSFTIHALLVAYPVMLTFAGEIRPSARYIPKCVVLTVLLSIPGLIVNILYGSNFMFLNYAEPGNPLYIFEQLWGSHLLGLPVLIAGVILIMHGPRLLLKPVLERRQSVY